MEKVESTINWWNQQYAVLARAALSMGSYYPEQEEEYHVKAYRKTASIYGTFHHTYLSGGLIKDVSICN